MMDYLLRRLAYAAIMVALASFVSFVIIELPPGDYLDQKIATLTARGDMSASQRIEEYRVRYGLDKPFLWRYANWVVNAFRGDFGESFEYERPVTEIIGGRLWMTVALSLATLFLTWVLAIPLGVYAGARQYSLFDQVVAVVSFISLGVPSFLLALVILYVAVVYLQIDVIGLFSPEYTNAPWSVERVIDLLNHLWIPALISALTSTGALIRVMRGNLLDVLGQPYIESARARGLGHQAVIWRHAARMALNPLIVILGSEAFPSIIVGSSLISIVLNLPTIGPLLVDSLRKLDMYLAGTCIVLLTVMVLVGNLFADVALAWLDPRIRLE